MDFGEFKVLESGQVDFTPPFGSFVSPVTLPSWIGGCEGHLFGNGLAAVLSFATGRAIKSACESVGDFQDLRGNSFHRTALQLPFALSGNTAPDWRLAPETADDLCSKAADAIKVLKGIPYECYSQVMPSIRLVQLAHLNVRHDFGLGYYLLASAIETLAQEGC
jgi:hypothetical protein